MVAERNIAFTIFCVVAILALGGMIIFESKPNTTGELAKKVASQTQKQTAKEPATISKQHFLYDPELWPIAVKTCKQAFQQKLAECRKHENYLFDFMSSVREPGLKAEDSYEYLELNGPCRHDKRVGDVIPIDIKSEMVDIMNKIYEIVCSFSCTGWSCDKKTEQPKEPPAVKPPKKEPIKVTKPKEPTPTTKVTPKIPVVQPPKQEPTPTTKKNCEELCAERGLSTQPVDHSQFIMSQLQQQQCVSGARISSKGTTTLKGPDIECKCYSKEPPQINVDTTPPVCQTPCGGVQCGSSTSCPCPDKPNCVLTASCAWKGWKWDRDRPVPVVGTQTAAQG